MDQHTIPVVGVAAALAALLAGGTVALTDNSTKTVTVTAQQPLSALPTVTVPLSNGQTAVMALDTATGLPICDTPQAARPVGYDGGCSHGTQP